jgi:hypothetical protein
MISLSELSLERPKSISLMLLGSSAFFSMKFSGFMSLCEMLFMWMYLIAENAYFRISTAPFSDKVFFFRM